MATAPSLINNEFFINKLLSSPDFEDAVGGDMEAWGLYHAVEKAETKLNKKLQWIIVKGICDWGFNKESDWQPLAAATATDLIFMVLSSPGCFPRPEASSDVSQVGSTKSYFSPANQPKSK